MTEDKNAYEEYHEIGRHIQQQSQQKDLSKDEKERLEIRADLIFEGLSYAGGFMPPFPSLSRYWTKEDRKRLIEDAKIIWVGEDKIPAIVMQGLKQPSRLTHKVVRADPIT